MKYFSEVPKINQFESVPNVYHAYQPMPLWLNMLWKLCDFKS